MKKRAAQQVSPLFFFATFLLITTARATDEYSQTSSRVAIVDPWNAVVVESGEKRTSRAIIDGLEFPFDGRYWQQKAHVIGTPEIF